MEKIQKKNTTETHSDELMKNCLICGKPADLELENGKFICDECAQIQGERSEN